MRPRCRRSRPMNKSTLAIALAALLVGGVAVAAYQHARQPDAMATPAAMNATGAELAGDVPASDSSIPAGGKVEYADVVGVKPITEKQAQYAQVIGTDPVS